MANVNLSRLIDEVLNMAKDSESLRRKKYADEQYRLNDKAFFEKYESPYSTAALNRKAETERTGMGIKRDMDVAALKDTGETARQKMISEAMTKSAELQSGAHRYGSELGLEGTKYSADKEALKVGGQQSEGFKAFSSFMAERGKANPLVTADKLYKDAQIFAPIFGITMPTPGSGSEFNKPDTAAPAQTTTPAVSPAQGTTVSQNQPGTEPSAGEQARKSLGGRTMTFPTTAGTAQNPLREKASILDSYNRYNIGRKPLKDKNSWF